MVLLWLAMLLAIIVTLGALVYGVLVLIRRRDER